MLLSKVLKFYFLRIQVSYDNVLGSTTTIINSSLSKVLPSGSDNFLLV